MCGIAGMVGRRDEVIDASDVHRMCQTIVHRGPDDEGIYARGCVGLGMRRLSIIDVSGGRQPIHNEDQSVWIVFNGEIYNFPELRVELHQKGHKFYTNTDTEVIVHLYEDLGPGCIKKLRGMFAIALYDERRQYLLLARDRLGKKPLHYALDGGRLYFGSEIKTMLAVAPQLAEVDSQALLQFFYFSYIPDPHTAFQRIKKLPPGHLLEYSKGELRVQQYWDLPSYGSQDHGSPDAGSEEHCLEELERQLAEAVRIRLISDVPLGALLSGGVDSSIVVALMARASSAPVKTFSIGFENEDFNELHYARLVAKRFGTDHHELIVQPRISETLHKLTSMMEEPFGDSSMIPTYYVSCMARQHVTVALAGDGGDELFAGYDRYLVNLRRRNFDNIPQWMGGFYRDHLDRRLPASFPGRRFAWNASLQSRDRYLDALSFLPARHRERSLFSEDFLAAVPDTQNPLAQFQNYYDHAPATDPLSRLLYLDTKTYLPADVLTKVDRMSMATSLEVRAPILDHEFVEFVTGLPVHWKFRNGARKYVFKKLAERIGIPPELLHRRKQGFSLPLVHWMRQEMKDQLLGILLEPRTLQRGYFNPHAVRARTEEHLRGSRNRAGMLWQLLIFELWQRNFLERQPAAKGEPTCEIASGPFPNQHFQPNPPANLAAQFSRIPDEDAKPARLAIVAPSLRKVGGQSVQADLLMRNWKNDPAVDARFIPIDPEFPRLIAWAERVPYLRTLVRMPSYWASLIRGTRDVEVVHIFSASYWSFLLAPTAAWLVSGLRGKKTVFNYHSGEAKGHLQRSAIARAVLRRVDKRVVPSGFLRDVFKQFGLPVEVVPNMIDPTQFAYRVRQPLRPVFICTRGFEPYYAVDDVVRAFGFVQQAFSQARLLLVGRGSQEQQVRDLVRQLGLPNIEFVGEVPREQIGHYYDQADIFINASWLDNMPLSILEAFAAGTPVVSTAPEGIRYILEHGRTGLLCEPRDWRALGENAITLLRQPELAQRLAEAARQQSRLYHWETVREQWLQLYRSAIVGKDQPQDSKEAALAHNSSTVEVK